MGLSPTTELAYVADLLPRLQPGAHLHIGYTDEPAAVISHVDQLLQAQRRLDDVLLDMAHVQDGLALLDVGCGLGGTLINVGARWRHLQLVGLNIDPRQVAASRALAAPPGSELVWLEADACAMPLANATFDRVLAIECAFHFASRRRFFAEAARVLRRGGRLVVSDFVGQQGAEDPRLAVLVDAFGPWPDPLCHEGAPVALAQAEGLALASEVDATAHVLPSLEWLMRGEQVAGHSDGLQPAVSALAGLLRDGRLRMMFLAFNQS